MGGRQGRDSGREVGLVVELVVGGALVFAALLALGVIWAVVSLVFTLLVLPFKLLGWLFHGVAALLLFPFLLVLGLVGLLVFGAGMLVFLLPAFPLVLLGLGIWWLMRRRRSASHAAHGGSAA
jgi:hypothetical protein